MRRRGSHGWQEIRAEDKRAILEAIAAGTAPPGPFHLELDINDRCNVDCYFCNAMDVRTTEQVPYGRVAEIVDEAVANGLRSVRFSGGGDPLFHRQIESVIDFVHGKGLVIDNITTNALSLSPSIAGKLVKGCTREILISLNASDADDYARMMQVKPAIFDQVVANLESLVRLRGDEPYPCIVLQFLFDRDNYAKMPAAYDLGRRLGADVIAINAVLDIPRNRIQRSRLLQAEDAELLRPYMRRVIEADREAGLRKMLFELQPLNRVIAEIENELGIAQQDLFPTAPSFKEENGGCFFGYYTAVVRGNGDLHPCCLMMNPDYEPLGNAMQGLFSAQWNGPRFTRMRREMREVMLAGGTAEYIEGRFQVLAPQCVNQQACGLKNMYFRGDDEFYRDLDRVLTEARKREIRWIGNRQQIARAMQQAKHRYPRLRRAYERLAAASPIFRTAVKGMLGVRYGK